MVEDDTFDKEIVEVYKYIIEIIEKQNLND